ncbi:MAG: hypothetical protein ACREB8_13765 [Pseudolabrys sp.]
MVPIPKRPILAVLGLAAGLAGCTASPVFDGMLPAGAPARPATPYEYPAVHDMPPARPIPPMTEEQQIKLENELTLVREQQEATDRTAKKTTRPVKKKPAATDNSDAAGAKTNP